jgi:hypothetical protein
MKNTESVWPQSAKEDNGPKTNEVTISEACSIFRVMESGTLY